MTEEMRAGDEDYAAPHVNRAGALPKKKITIGMNWLIVAIVALLLCAVSFYAGIAYQKGHDKNSASSGKLANGQSGFGGGPGGGRRINGSIGDVTAISSSSITVNDRRTGSAKTYSITSATQITDNGSTVAYSDIQAGDTVLISASSSSSATAARIAVNPGFGGPASAQDSSGGATQAQ